MNKIVVKKEYFGSHYKLDCPYCGLNTNLLSQDERIYENNHVFCRCCYEIGESKKKVTPYDFYHGKDTLKLLQICNELPRLELAHLCGEVNEENDFYLDLFYDKTNDKLYFKMAIVDDPDPWYGTEVFSFITFKQAVELLNKNGIHILDGINESNWKDYFDFQY